MKYLLWILIIIGGLGIWPVKVRAQTWWKVQSVDTMKYSRDLARLEVNDSAFDKVIETQVKNIAMVGATHVAVATPYDEEFRPILKRWVAAARKYNLKVWFRGNWSGWEGWFGYSKISGEEHIRKTVEFIKKNQGMLVDGDIFTPCPECENGGPGDPRKTGDIEGFRQFLIDEYQATSNVLAELHLQVLTNFASMNGDVAKLVMDKPTTAVMGGLVVVDHYVDSPEKLVADVKEIADLAGGRVVLGEFGVPIPDINGSMTETLQAEWVNLALSGLAKLPQVVGLNYWVGVGGSTQLWTTSGSARKAVEVVKSFYSPQTLSISVKNEVNKNLVGATVNYRGRSFTTDKLGQVGIPLNPDTKRISVFAKDYREYKLLADGKQTKVEVVLSKTHEGLGFKLHKLIIRILGIMN